MPEAICALFFVLLLIREYSGAVPHRIVKKGQEGAAVRTKRTRFKTLIITKKKLTLTIGILGLALLFGITFRLCRKGGQQLTFSEDFYKTVLDTELNRPNKKGTSKRWLEKYFGFSPDDRKSILADFSPILSDAYITPSATPEPTKTPVTPEPAKTPEPTQTPVEERHVKTGLAITNRTNFQVDPVELTAEPLQFQIDQGDAPQVLIIHTHTTESFASEDSLSGNSDRDLDETKNITAVGESIAEVLRNNGIAVFHDTTVHDYPSYNGAYSRSLATVRGNLEKYPSICVILDVHRDGITKEDGTKVKVAADINGEKSAQCMFVIGSNAVLTHDHWRENLKLACKIQERAMELYPNLMRPILLREERFNQQISIGSVILEVGSNGNTLEEAKRGGAHAAQAIADVLKKN